MKKSVKKIVAVVLAVLLIAGVFAACSGSSEKTSYKIGVCQLVEHEALDAATKGFIAAVYDKIGEDNVTVDTQNAQNSSENCATIVNSFVANKYDLIMANATPALQAATAATAEIPIVATSITTYGVALGIEDTFDGTTGMNVTGTSDLAPLDQQAAMIKEICPDTKSVGIIYCSTEANSLYQAQEVEKYLAELGIKATSYSFSDSNDLQAIVVKAVGENDALYVPTDNTCANNTGIIDAVARDAKCPVFAGEEGICRGCGVATLSISYYDIGYAAGEMAADILLNGKDAGTVEIGYAPQFVKEYNAEICEDLGIEIPDGYVALDVAVD